MSALTKPLVVYIPDTRGVTVSRYGKGNLKIGPGVYTYSRLPGRPGYKALGTSEERTPSDQWSGTCPGASAECQDICYARRPVKEMGAVAQMWLVNSLFPDVPEIPEDATLIRLHVSGDFDTVEYIEQWITKLTARPDVQCWAYTRSWRVPSLLPALERLRVLPNVQLFASMDQSITEVPPVVGLPCATCGMEEGNPQHMAACPDDAGAHDYRPYRWRRAWIDGDPRAGQIIDITAHNTVGKQMIGTTFDGTATYVCPEETKYKANCQECGYCISGQSKDVTFLRH